ncbi:MAG: Rha family transcriptional regulator [Geobacteraceae bacterium]|nr:Rha family transcriptional regulator [Geobacteraceae bacterium]
MISLPQGAVFMKKDHAMTNSQIVAEVFGKEHKNVLRSINNLDCSEEFGRLNFEPSSYVNEQGKVQPMYYLTKNGFTFLVMGYTGAEAAKFKEAYIQQFDQMESALQHSAPAINPVQLTELIRQAVAAALPQAVSTEPRKMLMVDAADWELAQLKISQSTPKRRPYTDEERITMRVMKAQGMTASEISEKTGRTMDSVKNFFYREGQNKQTT